MQGRMIGALGVCYSFALLTGLLRINAAVETARSELFLLSLIILLKGKCYV